MTRRSLQGWPVLCSQKADAFAKRQRGEARKYALAYLAALRGQGPVPEVPGEYDRARAWGMQLPPRASRELRREFELWKKRVEIREALHAICHDRGAYP